MTDFNFDYEAANTDDIKNLVEHIAHALVSEPDEVEVSMEENDKNISFQLHAAPDDMGKIIGKQGRIAKAIRTLLKAASARQGKRSNLDIV